MSTNLLMIVPHDLGVSNSAYGSGVATPALERFGETATTFTNAFAVAPTCSPSRSAMMTGLYPHQSGMVGLNHLGFSLDRTDRHLANRLSLSGYRCILSGVQHEAHSFTELGYQEYLGEDPDAVFRDGFDPLQWDRANTAAVTGHLRNLGSSGPWFLSLGLFLPHRPFPDSPAIPQLATRPAGLPDTQEVAEDYRRFRCAVQEMDSNIGAVLAALDESGEDKKTVVVIVTDHGIDFPRYKNSLNDGGLGVTLMVRLPGQNDRRTCTSLVSLVDLYPTLLDLLQVPQPPDAQLSDARAIPALCEGTGSEPRRFAYGEINYHVSYQPERSVMNRRFRLLRRYHRYPAVLPNVGDSPAKDAVYREHPAVSADGDGWSLYDRWYDPLQNANLYGRSELAAEEGDLHAALHSWMTSTQDPLLTGAVPAPPGAAIAEPHLYSSWSADKLLGERAR